MISGLRSNAAQVAYANSNLETKESVKNSVNVSKQGDTSRVEELKEAINSGKYRVDLKLLSEKIADELL